MTQPDFRALCAELVEAWKDDLPYARMIDLIARATAALATPPPAPPSEEDLLRLWQFNFGKTPKDRFMDIAHFVLALAATPPPEPPADGEVAELVDNCIVAYAEDPGIISSGRYMMIDDGKARAALLQQLSAPAPVVVPMVLTKPQLEKLNEVLHSHQDEGPPYPEGWASPELEDLRQIIDRWSTAPSPAVVPVGDATTPPKPQPTGGRQIGPSF